MGLGKKTKTEHAGAKNGGGYWGKRHDAKETSKRIRRQADKQTARVCMDCEKPPEDCTCEQIVLTGTELPNGPPCPAGFSATPCYCGHREDKHSASCGCELCPCEWFRARKK